MNFKELLEIYIALLEEEIIHSGGGEMDFPCSGNTSMYATIWGTKKVALRSTDKKMRPLSSYTEKLTR